MTDQELTDQQCSELGMKWACWCKSRKYLAPPVPINILAKLQPRRAPVREPDGLMDADIAFFNMAVHGLADAMDGDAIAFVLFHYHGYRPIKVIADAMGISVRAVYKRVHKFARLAERVGRSIKRVHLEGGKCELGGAHFSSSHFA